MVVYGLLNFQQSAVLLSDFLSISRVCPNQATDQVDWHSGFPI